MEIEMNFNPQTMKMRLQMDLNGISEECLAHLSVYPPLPP